MNEQELRMRLLAISADLAKIETEVRGVRERVQQIAKLLEQSNQMAFELEGA